MTVENGGPDLGLTPETIADLPTVPSGWSAYPSLGKGFGAKKWFGDAYKDVVTNDASLLSALCTATDEQFGVPSTPPADDPFQDVLEAPSDSSPESTEIVPPPVPVDPAPVSDAPAGEGTDTPAPPVEDPTILTS